MGHTLCYEAADQKLNPTPGQRGLLLLPPTKEGKWFSHQKEKRKRGDFISILDTPPSLADFISISEVIIRGLKITTLRPPRRWFFLLRPAISYWSPDETCKTVSTCASVEEDQGTHVFDIFGYSKHRGMGHDLNSHIRSGFFDIGGYNWAIVFFPDGFNGYGQDYISVYLMLVSSRTKLRASCDIRLVDQYTGCSFSVHKTGPRIFNPADFTRIAPHTPCFIRRDKIEGSAYLRDDRLTIECVVTVFKKPHVTETKSFPIIDMPPADMTEHVAKLLEEKKGFDVSFIVGGETIEAHRFVLAMRSPVFKAEFYGSMREARPGQCITVKDMQPAVFKALLHFIYTDSLPSGDDTEMVRLLLVAVDRYAMDRLKLVCQSILCEDLNKDTVETTLALADQYNCLRLKDACLQFMELSGFKDLKATCTSFIEDALEKRRKKS